MATDDIAMEINDEEHDEVAGGKKKRRHSWRKPQYMKCPSCGTEFDRGAAMNCPKCGTYVEYPDD